MQGRTGYMAYVADDFILYVFSLVIFGAVATVAIQPTWLLMTVFSALAYMLVFFIFKHGVKLDWSSIPLIIKESIYYPVVFYKELAPHLLILSPLYVSFALALLAEAFFAPKLGGAFWRHPFPYLAIFYVNFGVITLFRTFILFSHLRRHAFVQEFLENTTWKQAIKGIDIRFSIIHCYITGLLSHLGLLLPALAFWRFTSPTYFREAALIVFYLLLQSTYSYMKGLTENGTAIQVDSFYKWFTKNHEFQHNSRFYFTIFHGHHHDAIPSSLLASSDAGFNDGINRSLARLWFLNSVIVLLLGKQLNGNLTDIFLHQYIPGLFPYSRFVLEKRTHHAMHHYGSLRPYAAGTMPYLQYDINNGYDINNPLAQWFAETAGRYENLSPTLVANYTRPQAAYPFPSAIALSILFFP